MTDYLKKTHIEFERERIKEWLSPHSKPAPVLNPNALRVDECPVLARLESAYDQDHHDAYWESRTESEERFR